MQCDSSCFYDASLQVRERLQWLLQYSDFGISMQLKNVKHTAITSCPTRMLARKTSMFKTNSRMQCAVLREELQACRGPLVCQHSQFPALVDICQGLLACPQLCLRREDQVQDHAKG